jgi:serine/threonine protein kinase
MYGLGATFWRLLAGRRMFSGTIRAILSSITSREPPSLQFVRADIPAVISKIVQRLLSKNPDERYARSVLECMPVGSTLTTYTVQAGSRRTSSSAIGTLAKAGHPRRGLSSSSKTSRLEGLTITQCFTYMASSSVGNRRRSSYSVGSASLRHSTSAAHILSGLNMDQ